MAASAPPFDFDHKKGDEIPTKHTSKEAICQLHWLGKVLKLQLQERCKLGGTTIDRILAYDAPERRWPRWKLWCWRNRTRFHRIGSMS
ncbi:hypothetical protein NA56DRAFT_241876 [Hyaloscypha hepaticicola]|uniref:Uncharacterized protein n=1 Tax=Hyaloscypha hepaticicola TaxID=2082293 RepID=A0A2J6PX71_9HELO|nr:hypothetical protein NA56DRAFT_241876 [Hyaloscypha hepaticicola]